MKIYDISVTVPYSPVYPGDPETILSRAANIKDGSSYNLTEIKMSLHAGTHADSPLHFIDNAADISSLSLSPFAGNSRIITVYKKSGGVKMSDLEPFDIKSGERLLIRTRNSIDGHIADKNFYMDYCALEPSAAEFLKIRSAALVGIDYASIGGGSTNAETHRILLGAGIAVLEWLDLRPVDDGNYILCAAPLKIAGVEGAPVRAVLLEL